jgi:hypothetical protein
MTDNDPIAVCAQTVFDADNERFLDIMTRPLAQRRKLFALFALHYEIAKIPYITQEPMLAMMRLQWWRDALGTLRNGLVENHPIILALSQEARDLDLDMADRPITARHWDIEETEFSDLAAQLAYFSDTFGALYALCGASLNLRPDICEQYGKIIGLQRYLHSAPALKSAGKTLFPDINGLLNEARRAQKALPELVAQIRPLASDHRRVRRDMAFAITHWTEAAQPPIPDRPLHNKWLRLRASIF